MDSLNLKGELARDSKKGAILWLVWIGFGVLGLIFFQNLLGIVSGVIMGVVVGSLLPIHSRRARRQVTLPKDYKQDIARRILADPRYRKVLVEYLHTMMPNAGNSMLEDIELEALVGHQLEGVFTAAKNDKTLKRGEWRLARGFACGTAIRLKEATSRHDKKAVSAILAISQFALVSEFSLPAVKNATMLIEHQWDLMERGRK